MRPIQEESRPASPLELQTRRREIERLGPWFHNVHLPDGVQTAPDHVLGDFPRFKWEQVAGHLPESLAGWRALDIGCNAGFYSIELARRGADVLAIDHDPRYLAQARWAVGQFDLAGRVVLRQMQVYELSRLDERFDLVLFMGVFYHLRYPLLALDVVADRVGRLMVFQTLTTPGGGEPPSGEDRPLDDREAMVHPDWPKMAFIEGRFAGDPTNWWFANASGVEAMLRSSGMRVVSGLPEAEIWICEPAGGEGCVTRHWDQGELRAATGRSGFREGGD